MQKWALLLFSDDVKYFGRHLRQVPNRSIFPLQKAAPIASEFFTGYETVTHYYGNQRHRLHYDSVAMGLDYDKLSREAKARELIKRVVRLIKQPSRIVRRIFRTGPV